MAKIGEGRFWKRKDGKMFLYISTALSGDSAFPFNPRETVSIEITDHVLTVKKKKQER